MKIAGIEAIPLEIPFIHGGKPFGWGGQAWPRLSILLVPVETESGLAGYGEAFRYARFVHSARGGRRLVRLPAGGNAPREGFAQ